MKKQVSVIIPNFNGRNYLKDCLNSLNQQHFQDFEIILVDNASTDDSLSLARELCPEIKTIVLSENFGFCRAVNEGIRASKTPFVLLLNNDTVVDPDFVGALYEAIRGKEKVFSCASQMRKLTDPSKMDDGGDFYCALGWAFARGKDKPYEDYEKAGRIFFSCAGAAIYRREVFEKIGYFDEVHFAYLEDLDVGYRARIFGYENRYEPKAIVYHMGSGTTGSRYNEFKVRYSARNNLYVVYKNMPALQLILNLPFLLAGCIVKYFFFRKRDMGREYLRGLKEAFPLMKKEKKAGFRPENFSHYLRIQLELWGNIIRRVKEFR